MNCEISEREKYVLEQISNYEQACNQPIEHLFLFEKIISDMSVNCTKEEEKEVVVKDYYMQFVEMMKSLHNKQLITVYINDCCIYYNTTLPVE